MIAMDVLDAEMRDVRRPVTPTPLPRVMVVHNEYLQAGGEDAVVAAEIALLQRKGHDVIRLRRANASIAGRARIPLALETLWSGSTHAEALALLRRQRPDVVHVHNTFPLVSPALYWACARAGVPVVQTMHNFRLACPQAMFLRDGRVCESCLGKTPWPALAHGCYRNSRAQTAVVVGMLALHRGLGTYRHKVARYIALSEFSRAKCVQAGLPAERLVVKPNFVDGGGRSDPHGGRRGMLFVGRLSPEKGLGLLREAWHACPGLSLRIIGTGPDGEAMQSSPDCVLLGPRSASDVRAEMQAAVALVVPSIWQETFGMVVIEAFAAGLPVIASRIGALAELVDDGTTGLLFTPGDPEDLARVLRWAAANPRAMAVMGAQARARFEALYTPDRNYLQLLAIYRSVIAEPTIGAADD